MGKLKKREGLNSGIVLKRLQEQEISGLKAWLPEPKKWDTEFERLMLEDDDNFWGINRSTFPSMNQFMISPDQYAALLKIFGNK